MFRYSSFFHLTAVIKGNHVPFEWGVIGRISLYSWVIAQLFYVPVWYEANNALVEKSLLDSFNLGLLHSMHGGREGGYGCIRSYSYQTESWVIAQFV